MPLKDLCLAEMEKLLYHQKQNNKNMTYMRYVTDIHWSLRSSEDTKKQI